MDNSEEISFMTRTAVAGHGVSHGHYSPAIRVGPLVFVSAQSGYDPSTGAVPGDGDFESECRQALANLSCVLSDAGSSLPKIVKTTVLYVDSGYLSIINSVFAEIFPTDPPARTAAVVGLANGRRITIDAVATV